MNETPQFSKLESLDYDILLAILGACDSFEDLAALIQASPTLFHTFLSKKASLLLSVVGNILGPATRDAALLGKTLLDKSNSFNSFYRQVDQVVHEYKAHLRVARPPWVIGLDTETVVALTHITRHTQFCIDLFGHFQTNQLKFELGLSVIDTTLSGEPGLSRNERIRIAQAILRRQVLASISRDGYEKSIDWSQFMRALLPLFRTWEWQQISDMDYFMSFLLRYAELDEWFFCIEMPDPDLEAIVQTLKFVLNSNQLLIDCMGDSWIEYTLEDIYCGILHFLEGSHRFGAPLLNDSQHSNTLGGDDDSSLEFDIDDQPWAWRDALCGNHTCRWGLSLVEAPPPRIAARQQYEQSKRALISWRSFGMLFWDRERVERLKQLRTFKPCQTGWLIPWQD
ncbi:hypothetical protein G3M48_010077 [Beauveria asiatica]|uniref:Uncharacterized protein n=1 Tax=Beauveria asiatica TaxID=1069075 RepID=A0AAW0S2U5_9HYPO